MSKSACLACFAVLCLSCLQPLSKAPSSWLGTYVGGSLVDDCDAVATDDAGNVYLACHSISVDLPGLSNVEQIPEDPMNVYVVKLSAQLEAVEWGVLLAGSKYDGAFDIAVDARGHVFVAGLTGSVDFPVTANAMQNSYGGGEADAFFAEIDPEGKLLEVSFLGGSETDRAFALDLEADGTLWLGGATWSSDFPGLSNPSLATPAGANAFVARVSSDGGTRIHSMILGGREYEKVTGIAVATDGQVFVVGLTESVDFPLVEPLQVSLKGSSDGFVAKFSAASLELLFSTFFGGAGADAVWGVDVMSDGRPVIAGTTSSKDLPITQDAFQRALAGTDDAFIASLASTGKSIDYCSYFGGSGEDSAGYDGRSIIVDGEDRVWLVGQTNSSDLPTFEALQGTFGGDSDGFVARFDLGESLEFASFVGGAGRDIAEGLALGPRGTVWITGLTASSELPFALALQPTHGGGQFDCFLVGLQAE